MTVKNPYVKYGMVNTHRDTETRTVRALPVHPSPLLSMHRLYHEVVVKCNLRAGGPRLCKSCRDQSE